MACGVHVADDSFIAAGPELVAGAVADREHWRRWWPDLQLRVSRDRGVRGWQWVVEGARSGSAEIWLEPVLDGTLVHLYLRLDPAAPDTRPKAAERERVRRALAWKREVNALKDELEGGRAAGTPAASSAASPAAPSAPDTGGTPGGRVDVTADDLRTGAR